MASPLRCRCNHDKDSSDLVALKISLLGDGQIGKSSFLTKYSGREKGLEEFGMTGANQARAYAKALNATLFFSSATYNINVNKIFKFITAKLFNLPWNLEHNITVGDHY